MNAKTWVPLTLAVVLGLAAALVARQMLQQKSGAAQQPGDQFRTVVVAGGNILPGTEIDAAMLVTAKVSKEMAQEDSFSEPSQVVGRVAQAPIYKSQPVLSKLLAPKGSAGGLQALVPAGMRAITIEVNEFSGVAGFLTPGCRVDVLATVQGEDGQMISQPVVQNVMVTAIGQRMTVQTEGKDEQAFRSVTLIATPEESQGIELAASLGRPRLVLRNGQDSALASRKGISLADLRSREQAPGNGFLATLVGSMLSSPKTGPTDPFATSVEAPAEPPPANEPPYNWTIKLIRGGTTSEVTMPLPQELKKKASKPNGIDALEEPITGFDANK